MNCKPGDLAIVIRPYNPENAGRIVEVLTPIGAFRRGDSFIGPDGETKIASTSGFFWWTRGRTVTRMHPSGQLVEVTENHTADECLRPIRDQDGEDEILRLVGKPEKTKEAV